jgi:hypothetical protein
MKSFLILWFRFCQTLSSKVQSRTPLLGHASAVILVCVSLSATGQAQQLQPVIVYRPLDTLILSGGPFDSDPRKICVLFSGRSQCSVPTSVASDHRSLEVVIPEDAVSGPVKVQNDETSVGTVEIQIDRVTGLQVALKALIDGISKNYLEYLIALAALGVLSMSIVQAIKSLCPVLRLYQWLRTRWWLRGRALEARENLKRDVNVDAVEKELIVIGSGGNRAAFYSADTDDFPKQLIAVGRLLINYPTNEGRYVSYASVLAVMASNITKADFDIVNEENKNTTPQQRLDALNRVQQEMTQAINAFSTSSIWWWQNGLHTAAFATSSSLAFLAVWYALGWHKFQITAFLTALFAAFLAPVARDLVAAIQKFRSDV